MQVYFFVVEYSLMLLPIFHREYILHLRNPSYFIFLINKLFHLDKQDSWKEIHVEYCINVEYYIPIFHRETHDFLLQKRSRRGTHDFYPGLEKIRNQPNPFTDSYASTSFHNHFLQARVTTPQGPDITSNIAIFDSFTINICGMKISVQESKTESKINLKTIIYIDNKN